jgi:hypothetical protein
MYSAKGHLASPRWGCPIRTSPDQSLLAAPRGFSQPSTSFIGSWCQGIHRAPLLARRLDLSNPPSRQDQCSQKTLVRSFVRSVQYFTRLGRTERLYLSAQLLFDSSGAVRPRGHKKGLDIRRATPATGSRQRLYAIGDSSLRMIRLSSSPREHTRQATASAHAPRKCTISRRLRRVQVTLFLAVAEGGAEGTRTPDIRLAKAALSQLSYGPGRRRGGPTWIRTRDLSLIRTAL